MRSEKNVIISNDTELRRQHTPEQRRVVSKAQRVSHPTLATAIFHHFFQPRSAVSDIQMINCSERPERDKGKPAIASEWLSFLDAVNTGDHQTLHIRRTEPPIPLGKLHSKRLPKQLIIAICLFIAAVILGFMAPHAPL